MELFDLELKPLVDLESELVSTASHLLESSRFQRK